jgi:HEAT repeat protein
MIHLKIMELNKSFKATQIILLIFFYMLTIAASQQNAEDKVDSLIKKLQSNNRNTRAQAVIELGKIQDARIMPALINALKDADAYVRGQAAWSLGEIKDTRAVQPLITILKDDDFLYVRQESARALGKIKDSQAVQPLINALNDEYPDVREEAVKALIDIGAPVTEQLNYALKEKDLRAVADAYYFLICLGEPGTETILVEALYKYGTKRMAIDFINCGNIQLKEAAKKWAESHSNKIKEGIGASHGPKWKKLKSSIFTCPE